MGRSRYRSTYKLASRDHRPTTPSNPRVFERRRNLPVRSSWNLHGVREPVTTRPLPVRPMANNRSGSSTQPPDNNNFSLPHVDTTLLNPTGGDPFNDSNGILPFPLSQFAAAFPLPTDDLVDDIDDAALSSPDDDDELVEPGYHHDFDSTVRRGLKVWKASGSLLAVILTRGKNPLTSLHYELIIRLLRPYMDTPGGSHLPAFSTLGRTIFPYIVKHCLPRLRYIQSEEDPVDALPSSQNSTLIYPSVWALYDARCYSFFRCVYDAARQEDMFSFNNSPFIADRTTAVDETQVLHIPYKSTNQRISIGDEVHVALDSFPGEVLPEISLHGGDYEFRGRVSRIFTGAAGVASSPPSFHKPGDITAVLVPLGAASHSRTWYLSSRFWISKNATQRYILTTSSPSGTRSFTVFTVLRARGATRPSPPVSSPLSGIDKDGLPYIVYRFLLFHDDFNVSANLTKKNSVGAVYLLPLDLPSYLKTSPSSIRPVALTPKKMSSKIILDLITKDIVTGTTKGFIGRSPSGDKLRVYLDMCGSLADFKEASDGLQTLSHSGTAGCNLCNFRKNSTKFSSHSDNAYSTTSHSRSSAFTRSAWRHYELLGSGISNREANFIGMKLPGHSATSFDTFLRLEDELRRAVTPDSLPHARHHYKAFPCAVVAPDHCIVGNIRNVLEAVYLSLASPASWANLNTCFREALLLNGLPGQDQVFNLDSKSLNSCSFTILFGTFSVAPYAMSRFLLEFPTAPGVFDQVTPPFNTLFRLVNLLRYFPHDRPRDVALMDYTFGSKRGDYFRDLQKYAVDFLKTVDALVVTGVPWARCLDRPNIHRLLELTVHTVPLYGHIHHVADLTFEHKHQGLKQAYQRANNREAKNHHWGFSMDLYDCWKTRVCDAFRQITTKDVAPTELESSQAELYTLMFGDNAYQLLRPENMVLRSKVDRALTNVLTPSLQSEFRFITRGVAHVSPWVYKQPLWSLRGRFIGISEFIKNLKLPQVLEEPLGVFLLACTPTVHPDWSIFYGQAVRRRTRYDSLRCGSFVQVAEEVEPGKYVYVSYHVILFCMVSEVAYMVARKLPPGSPCPSPFLPGPETVHFSPLTSSSTFSLVDMRRVIQLLALYPASDFTTNKEILARHASLTSSIHCDFYTQDSRTGFPPVVA